MVNTRKWMTNHERSLGLNRKLPGRYQRLDLSMNNKTGELLQECWNQWWTAWTKIRTSDHKLDLLLSCSTDLRTTVTRMKKRMMNETQDPTVYQTFVQVIIHQLWSLAWVLRTALCFWTLMKALLEWVFATLGPLQPRSRRVLQHQFHLSCVHTCSTVCWSLNAFIINHLWISPKGFIISFHFWSKRLFTLRLDLTVG